MRDRVFLVTGGLLVIASASLGFIVIGDAMRGSSAAWVGLSVLICVGVLGAGMVGAGRGNSEDVDA